MNIRKKILTGYIILAMLTFLISIINYSHSYLLNQKYISSEKLTVNVKIMDQIVEKTWETRFFITRYIYNHSYDDNQQALKSLSKLLKLIVDIGTQEMDEERLNLFNQIHEIVIPYQQNYIKLAKLINRLDIEKLKFSELTLNAQNAFDVIILIPLKQTLFKDKLVKARQQLINFTNKGTYFANQYGESEITEIIKKADELVLILKKYQKQINGNDKFIQKELIRILKHLEQYKVNFNQIKEQIFDIDRIMQKEILPVSPEILKIAQSINKNYRLEEGGIRFEINEDFRIDMERIFVISAFSLGLSIFLGFMFSNRITNPIVTLNKSALKFAKGNLDQDIIYHGKDEIGSLASSFNKMKNAIQLKINDLKTLNLAGEKLVSVKKGADILNTAIDLMKEKVHIHSGVIRINEEKNSEKIEYITHGSFDSEQDFSPLMEEVVYNSINMNKVVYIENASLEDTLIKELPLSFIATPLQYHGKVVGALLFFGDPLNTVYYETDNEFIFAVSRLVISALKNVNMLELIEEKNASLLEASYTKDKLLSQMKRMNTNLESVVKERTVKLTDALDIVKSSNSKLLSSIEYAKRIQRSLLPDIGEIQTNVPESFIIWQPRDIVGGDMYFTSFFKGGYLLSVMDCTGHGVPGAFMTMLASSGLKGIIKDDGIKDPAEILRRLNIFIKTALHQHTDIALSDDGLEAAICYVDYNQRSITFSGAGLSLVQIENDGLKVIKGDRKNIGYKKSSLDSRFKNTEISVTKEMSFYLYTDGITDQLGGPKRIRFGKKNLQNLLLQVSNRPFDVQQGLILNALKSYQAKNERLDDVTVVGFKPLRDPN